MLQRQPQNLTDNKESAKVREPANYSRNMRLGRQEVAVWSSYKGKKAHTPNMSLKCTIQNNRVYKSEQNQENNETSYYYINRYTTTLRLAFLIIFNTHTHARTHSCTHTNHTYNYTHIGK